jgi:hypothetical protein
MEMNGIKFPRSPLARRLGREPVRTLWRKEKHLPLKGIEPHPSRSIVTVLTELSRAFTLDHHTVLSHPL